VKKFHTAMPPLKDGEWESVSTAPFDYDLELAVINFDGTHALVFPCRRSVGGWVKAETRARIDVQPTHWRHWRSNSIA
jgi:hypothetical protein